MTRLRRLAKDHALGASATVPSRLGVAAIALEGALQHRSAPIEADFTASRCRIRALELSENKFVLEPSMAQPASSFRDDAFLAAPEKPLAAKEFGAEDEIFALSEILGELVFKTSPAVGLLRCYLLHCSLNFFSGRGPARKDKFRDNRGDQVRALLTWIRSASQEWCVSSRSLPTYSALAGDGVFPESLPPLAQEIVAKKSLRSTGPKAGEKLPGRS